MAEEERTRVDSTTSSASRSVGHDLVTFDDVMAKDDIRRSMTIQKTRETKATVSKPAGSEVQKGSIITAEKSLYERIVGRTPHTGSNMKSPPPGAPLRNSIVGWFTKETAEERAIRSMIKTYRNRMLQEHQYATRAVSRFQKKLTDQVSEYERQERQLISWGLKAAIPKFHMQAWYRIERCRLYQKVSEEITIILENRQKKAQLYLQNFEESSNRRNKYSLRSTEEFCMAPDKLILVDSTVLSLQERLKRMDVLYAVASKQFMMLEPDFEWKDQKDRRKEFFRILRRYNDLPSFADLDNIETDLSWTSFCNWMAERMSKQKKIEQDFFDFIEDTREVEGRLFHRWQTCVLLSLQPQSAGGAAGAGLGGRSGSGGDGDGTAGDGNSNSNSANLATPTTRDTVTRTSVQSDPNDPRQSGRPTPLKVTPASIRAFIQYFATDIIGVKYNIPKECLAANKQLTEALFFRRIAPYVFRYQQPADRRMDDFWRLQCQRCRYLNPRVYHVLDKYLGVDPRTELRSPSSSSNNYSGNSGSLANNVVNNNSKTNLSTTSGDSSGSALASPALRREFTTEGHSVLMPRTPSDSTLTPPRAVRAASWTAAVSSAAARAQQQQSGIQFVPPGASCRPNQAINNSNATPAQNTPVVLGASSQSPLPQSTHPTGLLRQASAGLPSVCQCFYCQSMSLSQRLQRLPMFDHRSVMLGQEFARSARVLSWMSLAVTPREITNYLTLACKWILRDAIDVSGKRSIIGADEMVPLFTMVLIHAQIPNIHMLLRILTELGEYDEQGDISYSVANLEGSMRLVMDLTSDLPVEIIESFQQSELYTSIVASTLNVRNNNANAMAAGTAANSPMPQPRSSGEKVPSSDADPPSSSTAAIAVTRASESAIPATPAVVLGPSPTPSNAANVKRQSGNFSAAGTSPTTAATLTGVATPPPPPPQPLQPPQPPQPNASATANRPNRGKSLDVAKEDLEAMEMLGEWLRDQKTMEDTIAILQSDGWML